jgi:hypothetical protein
VFLHYGTAETREQFTIVAYAIGRGWWDETPEVPAPDNTLLKLDLTATGLLKSCPKCGLQLTSKKMRIEHCCKTPG